MESPEITGLGLIIGHVAQAEDMDEKTHEGYHEEEDGRSHRQENQSAVPNPDILIQVASQTKVSPSPAKTQKREKARIPPAVAMESKATLPCLRRKSKVTHAERRGKRRTLKATVSISSVSRRPMSSVKILSLLVQGDKQSQSDRNSAAATVMMKKTNMLPSKFGLALEKATNATLIPLSINSRDIRTSKTLRRMTTPRKPTPKSRNAKTKNDGE